MMENILSSVEFDLYNHAKITLVRRLECKVCRNTDPFVYFVQDDLCNVCADREFMSRLSASIIPGD